MRLGIGRDPRGLARLVAKDARTAAWSEILRSNTEAGESMGADLDMHLTKLPPRKRAEDTIDGRADVVVFS
eukprot:2178013-Pyramimonas_sp.AAC.1